MKKNMLVVGKVYLVRVIPRGDIGVVGIPFLDRIFAEKSDAESYVERYKTECPKLINAIWIETRNLNGWVD